LIVGGAKMSKSLENSLLKEKTEVYETYGMTENGYAYRCCGGRFSILPNIKVSQNEMNCLVIDAPKILMNKLSLMI
jgi:O-succinylbenzoic acid--CoA ligase